MWIVLGAFASIPPVVSPFLPFDNIQLNVSKIFLFLNLNGALFPCTCARVWSWYLSLFWQMSGMKYGLCPSIVSFGQRLIILSCQMLTGPASKWQKVRVVENSLTDAFLVTILFVLYDPFSHTVHGSDTTLAGPSVLPACTVLYPNTDLSPNLCAYPNWPFSINPSLSHPFFCFYS